MHTKLKGDIGQLIVMQKLLEDGWSIAIPYGENHKYDLIAERNGIFRRIQVKSVNPKNGVLHINCRSSNNWSVIHYNKDDFEVLAAVDLFNKKVYFISSDRIHRNLFNLRINQTKNFQKKGINHANDFLSF